MPETAPSPGAIPRQAASTSPDISRPAAIMVAHTPCPAIPTGEAKSGSPPAPRERIGSGDSAGRMHDDAAARALALRIEVALHAERSAVAAPREHGALSAPEVLQRKPGVPMGARKCVVRYCFCRNHRGPLYGE